MGAGSWRTVTTCAIEMTTVHESLADINDHPNSRIDDLLPWTYAAAPDLKHVA